jgi:flagellar motor switch protein FliN/FliY
MIMDIPIALSVEVGRKKIPIRTMLNMSQGAIIELDKPASELLELKVNNKVVAKGEIVIINGKFGIRIIEILDINERLKFPAKKI